MPNSQAPEIHSYLHLLKPGIICLLVFVYIFKSCIVNMNKKVDKFHPNLYRFYISSASVHHCRLRLGLSALNSQRFQYGFISNMSCDSCNHAREDVRHYIFFLPSICGPKTSTDRGSNCITSYGCNAKKNSNC